MAQADQKMIQSPLAFARLVRINLMHRRRTDRLLEPPTSPQKHHDQMVLKWT
ncbi:IS4 family transposase, partial [Agrobacterium rosae]